MGNQQQTHTQKSCFKSLWQIASRLGLGAVSSSLLMLPTYAEGTFQLGPDPNATTFSNQRLFEYEANYSDPTGTTTGITDVSRPLFVDIQSSDEIIHIAACGLGWTDDWSVEVYYVGPTIAPSDPAFNFNDQINNYPPASGTLVYSSNTIVNSSFGSGVDGDNNSSCDRFAQLSVLNPAQVVTVPAAVTSTNGAGLYEIRLNNLTQNAASSTSNNTLISQFDISVTNPVNPTAKIPATYDAATVQIAQGRIWSYLWAFNGRSFSHYTNHDFYVVVPGGEPGSNFVWQLDLDYFAGFVYEMVANSGGVRSPNENNVNVRGLSVPTASNNVDPQYRQYLSYPDLVLTTPTTGPSISGLRFIDSAGQDNVFTPGNTTPGVQQTGTFEFSAGVPGTFEIIIDTNSDGIFGNGNDVQLRGDTDASGNVSAEWDGRDNSGAFISTGSYNAQVRAIVGEYHFVAGDVETSGGDLGLGLTINQADTPTSTQVVPVYWDDLTLLGAPGESNVPDGGDLGGRHIWGRTFGSSPQGFNGTSWGDRRFIDTYVYGRFDLGITPAVVINDPVPNADDPRLDYGDAPDTYSTDSTNGNSGSDQAGAAHTLPLNLEFVQLGANPPDGETDANITDATATGDDLNGSTPDDEAGITLNALTVANADYEATVNVQNTFANSATTTAEAYVIGWVDFNQNGVFETNEAAVYDSDAGTPGVQGLDLSLAANDDINVTLNWTGLTGLTAGDTYARFRVSTDRSLIFDTQNTTDTSDDILNLGNFFGTFEDGEVEDYVLTIEPVATLDYGDAPDTTGGNGENDYTTTAANGGPFHTIDAGLQLGPNEPDGDNGTLQNATATADDLSDTDGDGTFNESDEDGVTLPDLSLNATSYTASVNVTNTTGGDAYLVAWIDFDENGTFDTDEGVLYDANPTAGGIQPIATGTTGVNVDVTWTNLASLRTGATFNLDDNIFARFRLTDTPLTDANGTQSVGALGIGEVEDYQLTLEGEAELLLVKRITAVRRGGAILGTGDRPGGQDTNSFNDDGTDSNDNDGNWPDTNTYLQGAVAGGQINPGDEVEYTIYFLNTGGAAASNVTLCDVIPNNMTYVTSSMELFLDNALPLSNPISPEAGVLLGALGTAPNTVTDEPNDGDRGAYFPPGVAPSPIGLCQRGGTPIDGTNNNTGSVVFRIVDSSTTPNNIAPATGSGTPTNSYGFIRFRAKIQ